LRSQKWEGEGEVEGAEKRPERTMMLGIQVVLFAALLSPAISLLPYYIQTDEGDDRFFQFSSGEGGQYRRWG